MNIFIIIELFYMSNEAHEYVAVSETQRYAFLAEAQKVFAKISFRTPLSQKICVNLQRKYLRPGSSGPKHESKSMKKICHTISCVALALAVSASFASCGKSDNKDGDQAKTTVKTKTKKADPGTLPNYRYVDSDSILAKYNLAKDYNEEMLRLQNNYENTERQRQSALEGLARQYQQKMQNNGYMNQQAYEADMKNLQQRQQSAQNELGQMQMNMQNQALEAQKTVQDSILNYINEYNKSHNYDAILMKAATVYINPDLDITDEIIEGLNERYNKVKK